MSISIGDIKLRNRVLLAPMSGVSDRPFREIADGCKAGLVVTEMVASRELAEDRADMVRRAGRPKDGTLFAIQLAGREPQWMAEGARIAQDFGADIIDINMGCPARQVTGGYSGSALMRDLDRGRPRSGDAEDASRLGRPDDECAGARSPGRGRRHRDDHGAWAHALPVLQR
jgi:tRNA-dihydrouridine synthase